MMCSVMHMKNLVRVALVALTAIFVLPVCRALPEAVPETAVAYAFDRVVDGDTIRVITEEGRSVRVRLNGIDTPESVMPGRPAEDNAIAATAYLQSLLTDVSFVYLEFDTIPTDYWDRLLAWVYLPDGRMLNEQMVLSGFAKVSLWRDNVRYADRLNAAARHSP